MANTKSQNQTRVGPIGACLQEGRKLSQVLSEEDTTYFCQHKTNSCGADLLASEWMLTAPLRIPDVCQPGNAAAVKGGEEKLRSLCFRYPGTELGIKVTQSCFRTAFFFFFSQPRIPQCLDRCRPNSNTNGRARRIPRRMRVHERAAWPLSRKRDNSASTRTERGGRTDVSGGHSQASVI